MADLLLELFSEEIPARMQKAAAEQLFAALDKALREAGFAPQSPEGALVTPRRLAVHITGLAAQQADVSLERKGPRADAPAAAIEGFLKSTGLSLAQLENRGGVYFATIHQKGKPTAELLKGMIEKILAEFSWPKSMRWGAGTTTWVRPLHSILCLFDGSVVPVEFAGLTAGNVTYGHRFLAPAAISIPNANAYEGALEQAHVLVRRPKRMAAIKAQAEKTASAHNLTLKTDEGLLEEVTGLVEWPVVLAGRIDKAYMDLPPEVLVSEMRAHQKYFALERANGTLADIFLITANMVTEDGGKATVAGNERVLRARLSDGRFFWDQDRKKTLDAWAEGLKTVTYHAKLGTVAQKVERVAALAVRLARDVPGADSKQVERAARLAKADLVTGMVGEFPDLQGVMGRYYAQAQGESAAVADAIRDHYKPQGPTSGVPAEPTAICVALADKLDTLCGLFAIGEKPTGSKDPFALRRAALGVIRIVLENGLRLRLGSILAAGADAKTASELLAFFHDRLIVQLKDQGFRHDVITAVIAKGEDDLVRIVSRATALQAFLAGDNGMPLLAAYKRAANILAIEEKKDNTAYPHTALDTATLTLPEERALSTALAATQARASAKLEQEDFTGAMADYSTLRVSVDAFFDKVLVNDQDQSVRKNRLSLLALLHHTFNTIADFAKIEG